MEEEQNKQQATTSEVDAIQQDDPITADVIEVLDDLPKEKQQVILKRVLSFRRREMFSGPLPPSEDFANYEKTLPGAANRILELAEKQLEHRIKNESKIIDNTIKLTSRGQYIGAVLAASGLIITLILGLYGHDILAGSIGVTTVIYLAVLFVTNREPKNISATNTKEE